jgi:hypothetical protein
MSKSSESAKFGEHSAREPSHRPFQSATERYFSEVNAVWHGAQTRLQDMQFEFARDYTLLAQLGQTQEKDPFTVQKEFRDLNEKFQTDVQKVANDPEPFKLVDQAFGRLVGSVRQDFAEVDPQKLDPVTLGMIAQTLLAAAHVAEQANYWFRAKAAVAQVGSAA